MSVRFGATDVALVAGVAALKSMALMFIIRMKVNWFGITRQAKQVHTDLNMLYQ